MKTIPNLSFALKAAEGSDKNATLIDLLKMTLNVAPAGGFDFKTIRVRNRISDVLDKVADGGNIELEDADYAELRRCVESYRWGTPHPELLKLADAFGLGLDQ